MARMIPPVISTYRYDGERDVALKLQNDAATQDWLVLHSLDIANHQSQAIGECDFVVIIPGQGVLCLEIKGCRSLKVERGLWYYGSNPKGDKRGPFKQAAENMYSIRKYLLKKCPELSRLVFWSAVIFPYVSFCKSSPGWHDWQVIDARSYISRPISQLLLNVIRQARILLSKTPTVKWFDENSSEPDKKQCDIAAEILRPEFEYYETPAARRRELLETLRHYTQEQFIALDAMQTNPRVVFNGAAGTGKTLLAIESARRALQSKKRTLLISFNKNIAQWIKAQFSEDDFEYLIISTLHAIMLSISNIKPPVQTDSQFWTDVLPEKAIEALLSTPGNQVDQYQMLIIDEAQDILRPVYLDFLDLCLEGGIASGSWNIFGDFIYQHIYSAANLTIENFIKRRTGNIPVYTLGVNCRNTPRIAAYAPLLGGLTPDYQRILRADNNIKPELIFYNSIEDQKIILSEKLHFFRETEKFKGSEIVVLSPLAEKCCAKHLDIPWRDRIKPYSWKATGGHIQYSTIHSFKGLEAPVVIVTDLNEIKDVEAMNLLYIAVTRSLSRLVLLLHSAVQNDLKKLLGVE